MDSLSKLVKGNVLSEHTIEMVLEKLEEPQFKKGPHWDYVLANKQQAAWDLVINWVKGLDDYNPYGRSGQYKMEWYSVDWKQPEDIFRTLTSEMKLDHYLVKEVMKETKKNEIKPLLQPIDIQNQQVQAEKEDKGQQKEEIKKVQIQTFAIPVLVPKVQDAIIVALPTPLTTEKKLIQSIHGIVKSSELKRSHKEKHQLKHTTTSLVYREVQKEIVPQEVLMDLSPVKESPKKIPQLQSLQNKIEISINKSVTIPAVVNNIIVHNIKKVEQQNKMEVNEFKDIKPVKAKDEEELNYYVIDGYEVEQGLVMRMLNKVNFSLTVGETLSFFVMNLENSTFEPFVCGNNQSVHQVPEEVVKESYIPTLYCRGPTCCSYIKKPVHVLITIRDFAILTTLRTHRDSRGEKRYMSEFEGIAGRVKMKGNKYEILKYPLPRRVYETSVNMDPVKQGCLPRTLLVHGVRMNFWMRNYNKPKQKKDVTSLLAVAQQRMQEVQHFVKDKRIEYIWEVGGEGLISSELARSIGAKSRVYEAGGQLPLVREGVTLVMFFDVLHQIEIDRYNQFLNLKPDFILIREHDERADFGFLEWVHYEYGDRGPFYWRQNAAYTQNGYEWQTYYVTDQSEFFTTIIFGKLKL